MSRIVLMGQRFPLLMFNYYLLLTDILGVIRTFFAGSKGLDLLCFVANLFEHDDAMTVPPQKFRELVLQLLYSHDVGQTDEEAMVKLMMKELAVTKKVVKRALDRVRAIVVCQRDIDAKITSASASYAFDRIQVLERNILRLAVYELFSDEEIPAKVAITEALRLCRKFGTAESGAFVNAVLDHLYKASIGEGDDAERLEAFIDALVESEERAQHAAREKGAGETSLDDALGDG